MVRVLGFGPELANKLVKFNNSFLVWINFSRGILFALAFFVFANKIF